MAVEVRPWQTAGKTTHYVSAPSWVSNPDDPLFFMINRGTNVELVVNLYKLLDQGVVLVEHDALEGPFAGVTDWWHTRSGDSFPTTDVQAGDLFYRTDEDRIYVYIA